MHGSVAWQSCGGQQNEQGKMGPNFTSMHSCVKSWAGSCEWYVWSFAARKRGRGRAAHILQIGIGAMAKDSYQGLGYWVYVAVSLSLGMDLCLKCGVNQQNQ